MAFEKISNNLHKLNENIRSYIESSAEYYKLEMFNKGMKGVTTLVNVLILTFLFVFTLIFISVAISIWLSGLIGVPSSGFFIVGGFYLLMTLFMVVIGRSYVEKTLLVKVSRKVFNENEDNGHKNEVDDETI